MKSSSLNGHKSQSRHSVYVLPAGYSGCAWWRQRLPLAKLKKLGSKVDLFVADNASKSVHMSEIMGSLDNCSVAHIQAPGCKDAHTLIRLYRAEGKKVAVDYDDFSFDLDPSNPRYKDLGTKECEVLDAYGKVKFSWKDGVEGFDLKSNIARYQGFVNCVKMADMVTTTTEYLANKFRPLNPNVRILPNSIDLSLWKPLPRPQEYKDQVRVGWFGGDSHYADLLMLKEVFPRIIAKYPQVKIVLQAPKVPQWQDVFSKVEQSKLEWYEWVDLRFYPLFLSSRHIDIGLCPLADSEFNRCKSSIKWMEYAAFNSTSVCQNMPPYSETILNGETGLLANGDDEWVEAISKLVEDKDLRERMGHDAFEDVKKNHNLDVNCRQWERAYLDLAESVHANKA